MKIVKGQATQAEQRAIEIALKKLKVATKRIWAAPQLRKGMTSRWR